MSKKIKHVECRHVLYGTSKRTSNVAYPDDMVFIKKYVTYEDDTREMVLEKIVNPERSFYVTKPNFKNHEQKKTREYLYKVDEYSSTQAGLSHNISRVLRTGHSGMPVKKLALNPYLYGTDVSISTLIKHKYKQKYPNVATPSTMAVLDLETDVVDGDEVHGIKKGDPDIGIVTYKDRAVISVTRQWIARNEIDPQQRKKVTVSDKEFIKGFRQYISEHKHMGKVVKSRGIDPFNVPATVDAPGLHVVIDENPLELIKSLFERLHAWKPDFVCIWNIDFDIPRIEHVINKYGADAGDIFCDPEIPKEFRKYRYVEGSRVKVTEDGFQTSLDWYDQWHYVDCLASFYFLDQACVFRTMRFAGGKIPGGMSLDNILRSYAGTEKLKSEIDLGDITDLQWHQQMSTYHKFEYMCYALYDGFGCEILDEMPKVRDISMQFTTQCVNSDYHNYKSMPKRSVDKIYYTCLESGMVLGASSTKYKDPLDDMIVSRNNIIITLPTHCIIENGIDCIEGSNAATKVYIGVYDVDVEGAYPNGQIITNSCRETTVAELCRIEGLNDDNRLAVSLNLTGGTTNAMEISAMLYKMPTLAEMVKLYDSKNNIEPETRIYR